MSSPPLKQYKPLQTLLTPIAESEIVEVAKFVALQSGRESAGVERHLRWLLLENPARDSQTPLGWALRSPTKQLFGCILYVPQIFRCGQKTFRVLGSSSFYVDERYRGAGGMVFLRFSEAGRKWPLFGNSANADAAKLWKARGAVPIPYSDHELLGVLRWRSVIEEALNRRGVPEPIARIAGLPASLLVRPWKRLKLSAARADDLVPIKSAAEVPQLSGSDDVPELRGKMTANRDPSYIQWRYFSKNDATIGVFAFRNKLTGTDILVTVNQRPRGYRGQIRSLNVLDIYPPVAPEIVASIVAALADHYRGVIDALVLRNFDEALQDLFVLQGFIRRQFDAPNGWLLDKAALLPTRDWYMVPADGDWLA
jgi:hypothetical protein